MKWITFITVFLLAGCCSRNSSVENHKGIDEQTIIIDNESTTIENKFPDAKPHTDKIKKATPIIREASYEQQEEIQRLERLCEELQKKETTRFKWVVCLALFGFGGISCYFGITKLASKFTALGLSMLGGSISLFYYWSYIERFAIPILILYGIVTGTMGLREKDEKRIDIIKT
jgi:hypothetical protein